MPSPTLLLLERGSSPSWKQAAVYSPSPTDSKHTVPYGLPYFASLAHYQTGNIIQLHFFSHSSFFHIINTGKQSPLHRNVSQICYTSYWITYALVSFISIPKHYLSAKIVLYIDSTHLLTLFGTRYACVRLILVGFMCRACSASTWFLSVQSIE